MVALNMIGKCLLTLIQIEFVFKKWKWPCALNFKEVKQPLIFKIAVKDDNDMEVTAVMQMTKYIVKDVWCF